LKKKKYQFAMAATVDIVDCKKNIFLKLCLCDARHDLTAM